MRDFSGGALSNHLEYHPCPETMSHRFENLVLALVATAWLLAGAPAWSQDEGEEPVPAAAGEGTSGEGDGEAGPDDETGSEDDRGPAVGLDEIPELDEQTYEEDDDDFIPTEEIPVDQSIPFPTDI